MAEVERVVREEVPVGRLTHLYVLRRERTEPAKKRLQCHNKGITKAGAWTRVRRKPKVWSVRENRVRTSQDLFTDLLCIVYTSSSQTQGQGKCQPVKQRLFFPSHF